MRLVFLICLLFWLLACLVMLGCASPARYQAVPAWLVPLKPVVPTVSTKELACLSDEAYTRLAQRDRACWQHVLELRAVLGVQP